MARALEWSQRQGDAVHAPALGRVSSTFYADDQHQFRLQVISKHIMVSVVPAEIIGDASSTRTTASPNTTAKVKDFLEESLADIKTTWAPRIQYIFCIACPCKSGDQHYIDLDKFLSDDSRSVQCCRGKLIAKGPVKQKFCQHQEVSTNPSSPVTTNPAIPGQLMISYQWDAQDRMIKLRDKLRHAGYSVWMDIEKMEGSILESMGKAVENADVVLTCISQKYQDSQNCRSEAEYAYTTKKPIIPLKIDGTFKPSSWLGPIIGAKMYYRVDTDEMLDGNWAGLLRDIEAHVKGARKPVK
ncbi:uncharacterized protein [Amphiura filiformis]|uniref:uncharacterized protein n=1 Tax=Amphiura filiformis TaxID=82378 RepID=UPI003B211905